MNWERFGTPIERCLSEAYGKLRSIGNRVLGSYASKIVCHPFEFAPVATGNARGAGRDATVGPRHNSRDPSDSGETREAKNSAIPIEYRVRSWSAVAPATVFYNGLSYRIVSFPDGL